MRLRFALALALAACLLAGSAAAQGGVVAPVVVHHHEAVYPPAALAARQDANVVLVVTVDERGHVAGVDVAESGGKPFDDAAVAAMRLWTFEPATRGGRPVAARIRVPFHFAPPPPDDAVLAPAIAGRVAAPAATPEPAAPEAEVAEVRVLGRSHVPSRGAGDYDVPVGKLAGVPRMDSASLLRLAPGVLLTNEGGVGHPYQIFLRGFDAREGQDIEFTLDGMPVNEVGNPHGNGVADTHFVIPELVTRLRVIEGPFAPQQGNFAVAGSALYELGLDRPGLSIQGRVGSFGTKRLLLLYRPAGQGERTFGGAELFSTDGFGENRAAERATAMGGYEGTLGETGSFRVVATSYATHYSQAGVLRRDDVDAGRKDFYGTYDTTQGGDSSRHTVAGTVQGKVGGARASQSVFLGFRDFRLRQNFTGFLEDPQRTWQSVHGQRGDLVDQRSEQITFGGRGSARDSLTIAGREQSLELAYFARYDRVTGVQQRDRVGTNVPYRTELDLESGLANLGVYADASLHPLPFVTLRGGVRGDLFHYRVTDRCALTSQSSFGGDPVDTECFRSDRLGYRSADQTAATSATLLQPRATVLLGSWAGMSLSASYGKGARSLDPQYVNQDLKTPFAEVDAMEAGVAYVRRFSRVDVQAKSVFFRTEVDKDLFFNQTEGRNTLADGTTRTGWAGNARATGAFFDVAANLTFVRAVFDDTRLVIPYAPSTVARVDGVLFGELPIAIRGRALEGSLGSGLSYVGPRPLPLDERSDANVLLDLGASVKWRQVAVGLVTTNLLGRRYRLGEYNYTSDFRSQPYPTQVAARHFTAGEPRAVYASLTLTFGGEEKPR
ncbi:MAG: TonB family protein [Myxococcales bacterium]|nr:TonB family protein [Myxococcales bacterium]